MKRGVLYLDGLNEGGRFCYIQTKPEREWPRHIAEKTLLRSILGRLPRGAGMYKVTLGRVTIARVKETRG